MANPSTKSPYHSLIYGYLKKYQDDPTSRVFAPLAEAYRKAGMPDEAIDIAREGLRVHPSFVGGRVALARALFDKADYAQVIQELGQVSQDVPDNLIAQRLIAESALMLGRVAEALSAYKMLLYFMPQDVETAQIVQELEAQAYERGTLVLRTDPRSDPRSDDPTREFDVRAAQGAISQSPEVKRQRWVERIELMQNLMLRITRYRIAHSA